MSDEGKRKLASWVAANGDLNYELDHYNLDCRSRWFLLIEGDDVWLLDEPAAARHSKRSPSIAWEIIGNRLIPGRGFRSALDN